MTTLTGEQIAAERLDGWANLACRQGGLVTRIPTPDYTTALKIVAAIGAEAEEMDHHPDIDLRYDHLDVRLISHDVQGVTRRDVRLARAISAIAVDAGLELDSSSVSRLEMGLDSPDFASVAPFWRAVLAVDDFSGGALEDLGDSHGSLPAVWFQRSGSEEPRQRWHPDLWIEPAQVQPRIAAAIAAGGTLVSDAEAPSFWVLADAEGNRMCLCTWQAR